jgi:predicted DsbA family dithiol-disulfide isomerase
LQKEWKAPVRWVAFPLHPETPEGGRSLKDLFAGRDIDITEAMSHLKRVAADEGLPFGARTMTYNSRKATILGKWADEYGRADEWRREVFRAYFARGENIALPDVLYRLAETVGLDPKEAALALAEPRFAAEVDQDWEYARSIGVTAVPTFMVGRKALVGAHPYEALVRLATEMFSR